MTHRKVIAAVAALGLVGGGSSAALAAQSAPNTVTVKGVTSVKFKANRFIQDGTRWNKDVYTVKSGGTVKFVHGAVTTGPHTFTIVKKGDLPKTAKQVVNCKVCNALAGAHGADPSSEGPPKFQFVENGKGQDTAPDIDQPGDSAFLPGEKASENVPLKVTAKKGANLYVLCIVHPWMQAKLQVR